MVVIELEPEEATRPSSPASEEKAAAAAGGEAARPSSSAAPEEAPTAAAAAVGGEASRAAGEEEEAFEDALTDEQLREKSRSQANDAKAEGNKLFGSGQYEEALSKYEMALQIAAELESSEDIRAACHSNRAVCFLKLGKHDETVKECTKALELNPSYLKALLRRAEAHEKLEHYDEAIADMKKVIEMDPSNQQATRSLFRLEPLAAEKREKVKEEMIGKLKDLGNSVLGRFGMSVDNFKAVKDPNTGSYSIQFQK
ncbi:Tetratricopeptide repeat protein 1 [Zea mays]|uniref:Tetratricopeptide repeat protein 1 n=1 Tax=Zea mays TaxID=4577 RepID=A0A3L6DWC5_MAIZE|nr:Tetratricopeptide repeat protein 1 [Zea mays]